MLLLVVGFMFLAIGSATGGILFELFNYDLIVVLTILEAFQVTGLSIIVYSILRGRD